MAKKTGFLVGAILGALAGAAAALATAPISVVRSRPMPVYRPATIVRCELEQPGVLICASMRY